MESERESHSGEGRHRGRSVEEVRVAIQDVSTRERKNLVDVPILGEEEKRRKKGKGGRDLNNGGLHSEKKNIVRKAQEPERR